MAVPDLQSVRQSGAGVCALRPEVPPGGAGCHGHQSQGEGQMTRSRGHLKVKIESRWDEVKSLTLYCAGT